MSVGFPWTEEQLSHRLREAVRGYWHVRTGQADRQRAAGVRDTGTRGEVTGGRHLHALGDLLCDVANLAGFTAAEIRFQSQVELPGYYRPTKKWDMIVVRANRLCAAIEMKSHVGSFGNNFNNRTEEAIGNSVDLWRAYQQGTLGAFQPWVGYLLLLEDAPPSTRAIRLSRSLFRPEEIFERTSYADRYRILCERMVLERNYTAAALILSARNGNGSYRDGSEGLSLARFIRSLYGHLVGCA